MRIWQSRKADAGNPRRNKNGKIGQDIEITSCVEADDSELIRVSPNRPASFLGQRLPSNQHIA